MGNERRDIILGSIGTAIAGFLVTEGGKRLYEHQKAEFGNFRADLEAQTNRAIAAGSLPELRVPLDLGNPVINRLAARALSSDLEEERFDATEVLGLFGYRKASLTVMKPFQGIIRHCVPEDHFLESADSEKILYVRRLVPKFSLRMSIDIVGRAGIWSPPQSNLNIKP